MSRRSRGHSSGGAAPQSGRIRPDQRSTDDTTPTVEGPGLQPGHQAAIFSTEDKSMNDNCRRDYRNRIRRVIDFLHTEYPEVADVSVRVVRDEERDDPTKYYKPDDAYDFIYSGLNAQYIKAFLASMKYKPNGRMYGYSHISKFYDAIKWGCGLTSQRLSTNFYTEMENFLKSYKKDYTAEKKKGNVDEKEADAISSPLFQLLMKWAVDEGNIFVWCLAMLMWHLMARSVNVDCIALHSIKRGMSDSISFKYDETKTDKTGEFVQEKNCYSNPFNPLVCIFTALGCYLSIHSEALEKTEFLFLGPGRKYKTAAELNEHVPRVTGIPPHVEHMRQIKNLEALAIHTRDSVDGFRADLVSAVSDAVDAKVEADGQVNAAILQASLKGLEERILERIDGPRLDNESNTQQSANSHVDLAGLQLRAGGDYASFVYRGKFWPVPQDFQFPVEVTRLNGWRIWCMGKVYVDSDNNTHRLKPFHLLSGKELPNKKLQDEFNGKWKPIFTKMQEAPGIPDKIPPNVDEQFIRESFAAGTEYLKQLASYIWSSAKDESDLSKYLIGTWSRKISRSEIEKNGTPEDIANLPPKSKRNKQHAAKRGGWSIEKSTVRRVVQRRRRVDPEEANTAFAAVFNPPEPIVEATN